MANGQSNPPMSLENPGVLERLTEKSIKTMEKQVEEQTKRRLQANQSPQDILTNLIQAIGTPKDSNVKPRVEALAEEKVPSGGTTGLISRLVSGLSGGGFEQKELFEKRGEDKAAKIVGLEQKERAAQRGVPKQQVDTALAAIELIDKVKGFSLEGEQIERDVRGQLTTKGIKQTKSAEIEATRVGEDKIKKEQLKNDLDMYFEVATLLPTGEGIERFKVGLDTAIKGITQETPIGVAQSRLNSLNKRLRVTLVRAAGDVGNLNIVEQAAAEKLLFQIFDSTQERALKKAILQDLTRAVKSGDESRTKSLIQLWQGSDAFKKQFSPEESKGRVLRNKKTGELIRVFPDGRRERVTKNGK